MVLIVSKVNETERQEKMDQEVGNKLAELAKRKGFKKIFDALKNKKSKLIGHNCTLDILFTISHFGDELPKSYKEFKNLVRSYFSE